MIGTKEENKEGFNNGNKIEELIRLLRFISLSASLVLYIKGSENKNNPLAVYDDIKKQAAFLAVRFYVLKLFCKM